MLGASFLVIVFIFWNKIGDRNYLAKISLAVFVAILLAVLANKMLSTFYIIINYQIGEIVFPVLRLPRYHEYHELLSISVPQDIWLPEEEAEPLIKIILFILHNPIYWSKLFLAKTLFYLLHIRPYWSTIHNLYNLCLLLPIYFFALRLFFLRKVLNTYFRIFCASYICFHVTIVGITITDWDGRFYVPLIPIFIILASAEISILIQEKLFIKERVLRAND